MRNALIVRAADAVIAVAGEYGTLSEIALALKTGVPVVGVETWDLGRGPRGAIERATSPAQAVESALRLARPSGTDSAPP
jgi:predicted Rossmann-fold nucleotide-binding protein